MVMKESIAKEETKTKEETVYKFSNKGQGQLREAVIIEGKQTFIKYYQEGGFIQLEPKIEDNSTTLRPPLKGEYHYNPYEFKTLDEPQKYLMLAMAEKPETLLAKIKTIVKQFNEVKEDTANLLSLNIFGSYFQDRFSTVHYLNVVGANGTGKSAFGDTFECLGYRAVNVTNATESFYFRLFGTIEYGQVTIIVEEFDKMDENTQIMAMLKVGYQPNAKVPRMNNDNSKMDFFYPFGIKIMIAERSADEDKARGVLDRSFKIKSYKGIPDFNIKEIRNPQGNIKRQRLLDKINHLRKKLLMYRLIHFKDPFKEITIGLDGRDEELCKPLLQLLYSLDASEETLKMAESTFQHFLSVKNKRKNDLLEASIYSILKGIITWNYFSIPSSTIWEKITQTLGGERDNEKPNIWYSDDFGKKYRNTITKLICDKFGADIDHKDNGNNLVFDYDDFIKMGRIYENKGIIKITPVDDE